MNSPFFSVIIPTFDREATIKRAIDSVLTQSFINYEVIVINDGSTDFTDTILSEYKQKIKIINQENLGVSAARNSGVKAAIGTWLAFLDSDDEWYSYKLQDQYEQITKEPDLYLFHSDEDWIRNGVFVNKMSKHKKGGGNQFINSLKQCFISPSTACIRKDIFKELGMFNESFQVCEDYDLWLKFTSIYEIGYLDRPLIKKHGGHVDQLSMKFFAMDFYRIQSIDWVLKNRDLDSDSTQFAVELLLKKCERLIKGYLKHKNLKDLPLIEAIRDLYLESK